MTTTFLSQDIWPEITNAVRATQKSCLAAVAYFGAGSSRRLPLPSGSCLVVDASDHAVGCGQTCPAELEKLLKRSVRIFSVPNLHAKVFVVAKTVYVGSANVSKNSAEQLIEAVVRSTEPSVVSAARQFVKDNCLHELSPELLKKLKMLYRPPQGGGGGKGHPKNTSSQPTLPRMLLAQLQPVDLSDREQQLHDEGLAVAKKHRKHPRIWETDDFRQPGKGAYRDGDVVIQVTDEGHGKVMVTPPANVIHVLPPQREGNKTVSFVYMEGPARKRRQLKPLAKSLGCTQKELRHDGVIRKQAFKRALLRAWAVTL